MVRYLWSFCWKLLSALYPPLAIKLLNQIMYAWYETKEAVAYDNLSTSFLGKELISPIGIQSDMMFEIQTLDALMQAGAGFGTFGSYLPNDNLADNQPIRIYKKRSFRSFWLNYKHHQLTANYRKLVARRYHRCFMGVSLLSFSGGEIYSGNEQPYPVYRKEYEQMAQMVAPYCDYIVVNVSNFQSGVYRLVSDETSLVPLIKAVRERVGLAAPLAPPKILLKVPYALSDLEVKMIVQIAERVQIDGIIVAGAAIYGDLGKNAPLITDTFAQQYMQIAGTPLKEGILHAIREFRVRLNGRIPLIASGGIFSGKDAFDMILAGANVVEIGEVFYFNGPKALPKITAELANLVQQSGLGHVSRLVGKSASKDVVDIMTAGLSEKK